MRWRACCPTSGCSAVSWNEDHGLTSICSGVQMSRSMLFTARQLHETPPCSPFEMCVPIARWMPEQRMHTNTPLRLGWGTSSLAHRFQEAQRASGVSSLGCKLA